MNRSELISTRVFTIEQILQQVGRWRLHKKKIAFTNGVFDILHAGHIFSLSEAAKEADYLVVGLNSDASVKRLKGEGRPLNDEVSRAQVLASLIMVDAVVLFETDTPLNLIISIMPDVIVKGGDYTVEQVVGAKEVVANGGRVVINPLKEGLSTTALIEKQKTTGQVKT